MKYLILIYNNPASREIWEGFTDEQRGEGFAAYAALDEALMTSGELIVTEALADMSLAKRVAVDGGRTITTDGPFAEVKEHLAGFYLVDCDGMERAVEIAAMIPGAESLILEVRPVMDLGDWDV